MKKNYWLGVCSSEVAARPYWSAIYNKDRPKEFKVVIGAKDLYTISTVMVIQTHGIHL